MTSHNQAAALLLIALCLLAADAHGWQAAETGDPPVKFSEEDQTARQEILDGERWKQTADKFDQWLSVQTAYTPAQVEELKADLQRRIAKMPESELKRFLDEMEERLEVLMSPEVDQARRWANRYYTEKAQQKMAAKLGASEPIKMTASQLRAALQRFQEQRGEQRAASDAFNRSRQSQVKALGSFQKQQQAAQKQARTQAARYARRSSSAGSHYTPRRSRRPQRFSPAYPTLNYSVGPWGGIRIHR